MDTGDGINLTPTTIRFSPAMVSPALRTVSACTANSINLHSEWCYRTANGITLYCE